MGAARYVVVALYMTELDRSVKFHFRTDAYTSTCRNPVTFLSVDTGSEVRVHFPIY